MIVCGIRAAGVLLHQHVALKVELAGINGLDRAAVDIGNRVAGDLKTTGEGRLVFNIHRAAFHCRALGDAAVGNSAGLACCFLFTQIYRATVIGHTVANGAARNGSRRGPCPDRAAVICRDAACAPGISRVSAEGAVGNRCSFLR